MAAVASGAGPGHSTQWEMAAATVSSPWTEPVAGSWPWFQLAILPLFPANILSCRLPSFPLLFSSSSISHLVANSFIIKILCFQAPEIYSGLLSRKNIYITKVLVVHRIDGKTEKSDWEGKNNQGSSGSWGNRSSSIARVTAEFIRVPAWQCVSANHFVPLSVNSRLAKLSQWTLLWLREDSMLWLMVLPKAHKGKKGNSPKGHQDAVVIRGRTRF